jgi:hypothetical protein
LHVLLQAGELAGKRRDRGRDVLRLCEGREPCVDLGLELLQLVPGRLEVGAAAVGVGFERVEAGR